MTAPTSPHPKGAADLCIAFVNTMPGHIERIRSALQQNDLAIVKMVAHLLAGSASTFGCPRIGNAAGRLERSCTAGDLAGCQGAFDVLLAAAHEEAPGAMTPEPEDTHIGPSRASAPVILLVDDDVLLVRALARALEADGFSVHTASSARQALDLLDTGKLRPHLAVLDITMPGMSGLDLAARMDGVPYMFLSASKDAETAAQAAEAGAVGYLLKPIEPPQLLPAVRAALARATDILELRAAEQRLTQALRDGRETGMAVGMLMERYRIDRHDALRMLRNHARSNQRKLNDVATELLQAAETLNALTPSKSDAGGVRHPTPERRK